MFQCNYSAFARRAKTELLPTFPRLEIAFYAYSPLASGFPAQRNAEELFGKDGGRFLRNGKKSFAMYQTPYGEKPKLVGSRLGGRESLMRLAVRALPS